MYLSDLYVGQKVRRRFKKVGRSSFTHGMVGIVKRWRYESVRGWVAIIDFNNHPTSTQTFTSSIKIDLLEPVPTVTTKQIETKLEELNKPVTNERYAVIVDPVFDMRGEFNSYVTIHKGINQTVFRTKEKAEASAQIAVQQSGSPHVVIQFISRFSNPPIPKTVKEEYT